MSELKRKLSRRHLFAAAGTVGTVAAVASLVPEVVQEPVSQPQAKDPPERGGGYHLSDHVKRYYQTTLV